jgi:hypothetical protein
MKGEVMAVSLWVLLALLLADPAPASAAGQPEDLTAKFDPALVDINVIDTAVEVRWYPAMDPNGSAFSPDLEKLVRTRLETSGIHLFDQTADPRFPPMRKLLADRLKNVDPNTLRWRPPDVPLLRVAVDLVSSGQRVPVVLYVRTSLSRLVGLDGRNKPSFTATVWTADPAVESVRSLQWQDQVQKVVLEQVGSFIAARKAAAPHDGQAPVVSSSPISSYPFVASKSGSVYHRSDCRLARNISIGNRLGYSSREEAEQAGKKPCKSCKP